MKTLKPRTPARPSPAEVLAIASQAAPHHPPATLAAEDRPTTLNLRLRESRVRALNGAALAAKATSGGISADRGVTFSRAITALEGAISALRERAVAAELQVAAADRRAEQVEQALNSERARARANVLRLRVDALETALTAAELATARETERAARATAELAAARTALSATEAAKQARKALGLLARLRAALRGEQCPPAL